MVMDPADDAPLRRLASVLGVPADMVEAGVTRGADGVAEEIDWSNCNLEGELSLETSAGIRAFPRLRVFDLSNNEELVGELDPSTASFPDGLRVLDVGNTCVDVDIGGGRLARLPAALEVLSCSNAVGALPLAEAAGGGQKVGQGEDTEEGKREGVGEGAGEAVWSLPAGLRRLVLASAATETARTKAAATGRLFHTMKRKAYGGIDASSSLKASLANPDDNNVAALTPVVVTGGLQGNIGALSLPDRLEVLDLSGNGALVGRVDVLVAALPEGMRELRLDGCIGLTGIAGEAGVEGATGAEEGGGGERIGGIGGGRVGEEEGMGRGRVVGGVSGRPNLSVYMKP